MSDKFLLIFDSAIESKDTMIFKAIVFKEWKTNSTYKTYTGDKLMVHNFKNNCSRVFPEPEHSEMSIGLTETCVQPNLTVSINDLAWGTFNIENNNREVAIKPLVINTGNERLIQCFQHQIKIDGVQGECIREPFSIPITTKIEIDNMTNFLELYETSPIIINETNIES